MDQSSISAGIHITEDLNILLQKRNEMVNICRLSLIRKRQHLLGEILARPGRTTLSATEPIKCIFGFLLENDGCLEKADKTCDDCGAFCCDLHKAHSTHQTITDADPHIVLRQQIAASATLNTSAAATMDTTDDTTTVRKKAPARNTRADLNQRFLAITGRQTLDSKHKALKVVEFRAIVEALENGTPIQPATTVPPISNATSRIGGSVEVPVNAPRQPPPPPPPPISLPASDTMLATLLQTLLQSNPVLQAQLMAIAATSSALSNPAPDRLNTSSNPAPDESDSSDDDT
jgi:hypothetical protein